MLEHQLPLLPPFDQFWEEIPKIFAWLAGGLAGETLEPFPAGVDDVLEWVPPPTTTRWGGSGALEVVRFAATNHLCVELGYQDTTRIIEPYSLRRTRDGNLLLYAIKADTREDRSYRVDRVQRVKPTTRPFHPVYAIEFPAQGPLPARQESHPAWDARVRKSPEQASWRLVCHRVPVLQ